MLQQVQIYNNTTWPLSTMQKDSLMAWRLTHGTCIFNIYNQYSASGFQAYILLARAYRDDRTLRWYPRRIPASWQTRVRAWLRKLQWVEQSPWTWTHPRVVHTIDWNAAAWKTWRWCLFEKWQGGQRRDSVICQGVQYSTERCRLARQLYQNGNAHDRAILSGAAVSDARYAVMLRTQVAGCQGCHTSDAPTWHHLAWQCPAFQPNRPNMPECPMHHRMDIRLWKGMIALARVAGPHLIFQPA